MCVICEKVAGLPTQEALNVIAQAFATRGANRHLSALMDKVLDTDAEGGDVPTSEKSAFIEMNTRGDE